jgi:hypothetical protein
MTMKLLACIAAAAVLAAFSPSDSWAESHGSSQSAPPAAARVQLPGDPPVVESLQLHMKLKGMTRAEPPRVVDDRLVLSVAGPFRFVGAAFDHEGFTVVHRFQRNPHGVFVLAFPVPLKRREPVEYRLVLDGTWTSDPSNPRKIADPAGSFAISVADVPYLSDLHLGVYRVLDGEDGRTAHFLFRAAPGELVTVCGDFDNWDPFIHELSETSPGTYELSLPLAPGLHRYGFVYRGEVVPDPLNASKAHDREGRVVSVLVVGR